VRLAEKNVGAEEERGVVPGIEGCLSKEGICMGTAPGVGAEQIPVFTLEYLAP